MRRPVVEGQGMVEYGLIIALVALVAAVGFMTLGEGLLEGYNGLITKINGFLGI